MNKKNQKRFKAFVEKYEIKGQLIAQILHYHVSAVYQKLNFSYDVSEDNVANLKIGYYRHLQEKLLELEKELKKDGYIPS